MMDLGKLRSNDPQVVSDYVLQKFKIFNRITYSRKTRVRKCVEYYLAAEDSPYGESEIEQTYQFVFKQMFPVEEAEALARKASTPVKHKIESSEWLKNKEKTSLRLDETLQKLQRWKKDGEYQMGESFFARLETAVGFVDSSIFDTTSFSSEFSSACAAEIGSSVTVSKQEIEAKADLMVGFKQSAKCSFEANSQDWGTINAKLEESFKAGLWANGGAKASMERLGFSAEVQAAVAIGAQLNVEGEFTWTKGRGQLRLGGEVEAFAGARASAKATLSVSAIKGLEASIKAGAFAGFSVEATGSCSFTYDGKPIAKVAATAGITFGVGAEFEASIKAPIFGPTKISFEANLTVGFGASSKATAEIDFSEMALATSQEFRKVVYWRTLARGYEMTLMNSDARNLYYLNKAISRVTEEMGSTRDTIKSFSKVPLEKRPLLM